MINPQEQMVSPVSARVWIHLQDADAPVVAHVCFCGYSFEHMTQVLMGDVHPRPVSFMVFDNVTGHSDKWTILHIEQCAALAPIFAFGHELIEV